MTQIDDPVEDAEQIKAEAAVSKAESKRCFVRNTLSNVIFSIFNAVTSFVMVPFQIHNLGMANYGTVVLSQQFVGWTAILTVAITGTVGRYVTLYMARGETEEARAYFSTQRTAALWLIPALIPVAFLVSMSVPLFLKIPKGQELNSRLLFIFTYLSFIVTIPTGIYQVSTFIRQRFDVRNWLEVVNQSFRYTTWILLFAIMTPCMWHIGVGYVIGATAAMAGTAVMFGRLTPELAGAKGFSYHKFREMLQMGGWMILNQAGALLYLNLDAVIINRMLTPVDVGRYGTVAGLAAMLKVLSMQLSSMMAPVAVACYARQDWEGLIRASSRAVKFLTIAMALPLGIICGLSVPFLTWWLGPEFKSLSILVWLMLGPLVVNMGSQPLLGIPTAANKLAVPGFVTIGGGLLKVVIAVLLIKYTDMGVLGVAVAGAVSLGLKNVVFTPLYCGKIIHQSSAPMFKSMIPAVFVFSVVASTSLWLSQIVDLASTAGLLLSGLLLFAVFGVIIYTIVLNKDDRNFLLQIIKPVKKG